MKIAKGITKNNENNYFAEEAYYVLHHHITRPRMCAHAHTKKYVYVYGCMYVCMYAHTHSDTHMSVAGEMSQRNQPDF